MGGGLLVVMEINQPLVGQGGGGGGGGGVGY